MIINSTRFQASIFGEFSDIDVRPECLLLLMELFKDFGFIPTTLTELNNELKKTVRPRMITSDDKWSIDFQSRRIDIDYKVNAELDEEPSFTLQDFIDSSIIYLELLMARFNKQVNRIALNTYGLMEFSKDIKTNEVYALLVNPINYYTTNQPREWNLRTVARVENTFNETVEQVNVITNISYVPFKAIENDTFIKNIQVHFDINTAPDNKNNRFNTLVIPAFFKLALGERENVLGELERCLDE